MIWKGMNILLEEWIPIINELSYSYLRMSLA